MNADRFWAKVHPEPMSGCWLWSGAMDEKIGYGNASVGVFNGKQRTAYAHRIAYELEVGPIPEGLVIDHKCRNKSCVNPGHLEAVTQQVNMLRAVRFAKTKTRPSGPTCRNGHPRALHSIRCGVKQVLRCRACGTAQKRAWRQKGGKA